MLRYLALCCALQILIISCSSTEIKTVKDAKESYDYAMKLLKDERFIQARETFQEIKNKLPDSMYATLSELRIADSFYQEESYPEAISSYEVFEELHPKHPEREYVVFQIANSYFKDTPSAIDRDLEPAHQAVIEYNRLVTLFPNSKYKKDALGRIKECKEKIMKREFYIGEYYFKRDYYKAAIPRFEGIYKNYPDFRNATYELAIVKLYESYKELNDTKNKEKIRNLYKKEYPSSKRGLD